MDGGGTVTLQVSNIPPYLREEEFSRFCMSWEGCTGSRLQQTATGLKGLVDFSSTAAAQQACNLYNGWQGWGPRGLSLEILSSNTATHPQTTPQPSLQPAAGMSGVDATKDVGMAGYQGMMMGGMADGQQKGYAQMGVGLQAQAQPQVQQQQQLATQQRTMQQQGMMPQQQQGSVLGGGMQSALPYQQNSALGAGAMGNGQSMLGGAGVPAANSLNVQQILQQAQTPQQQQQQMMLPNTVQPQGYAANNMQSMNQQQQLLLAMQNAGTPTPMTGVGVNPMATHNPMMSSTPQNQMMTSQMQLPKEAADTLFCEGLPNDATEREVSHIFRPFDGFKEVRLIQRENKQSEEGKVTLGFFEFKTPACANAALNVIQGYQFDQKDPNFKLKISFAKYSTKRGRGGSGGGYGDQNRMGRANKRKNRDD